MRPVIEAIAVAHREVWCIGILVAQRLKRSGMRWRHVGGQAILNLRSLEQSGRFDRAWQLPAATYRRDVRLPERVVDICARRSRGGRRHDETFTLTSAPSPGVASRD
jgi:hypothetical protein